MKVEKVPLTKMEARVEQLESDKSVWGDLQTKISNLANQCASLYSYDNPFAERIVETSNAAVTATAARNADLSTHYIKVIQTASADKLISAPLQADITIPAGHYRFQVGEKEISFFFNGGSPKNFTDGLNKRAPEILRAQIIQAKPGEQVILLESQLTGASNTIEFEGDTQKLASDIGWIHNRQQKNISSNSIRTIPLGAFQQSNPYHLNESPDECLINPGENISLPLSISDGNTLSMQVKIIDISSSEKFRNVEKPFTMNIVGSASFRDVTLTNEISILPPSDTNTKLQPALTAENPTDLIGLFVSGDGSQRQIPLTQGAGIAQTIEIPLSDFNGQIESIRIQNGSKQYSVQMSPLTLSESADSSRNRADRPVNAVETARDAVFEYDGIKLTRPQNDIDDVNDQIVFTLHSPTDTPVSLQVETDAETVKDKVIEFAYHYNKLIEDISIYSTKDDKVLNELTYLNEAEKEEKRKYLGILQGDITLIQVKNRLQQIIGNSYDIQSPNQISMLFQLGIGSNLSSYSGYSAAKMRGYLEIDESKLDQVIQNQIDDLQKIFGYDTNHDYITDNGIAFLLNQYLSSFVKQGGIIDGKLRTFDQQISSQERDITNFNDRMKKKEADYKRQFGNMEAMYERLKDSSRALDSLNNGNEK